MSHLNGSIPIGDTHMDYVTFGKGTQPFILIPGLSDGLKTVKGAGLLLKHYYRRFAGLYKVYIFSRKNIMPDNYSTKEMADDLKLALDDLGIREAYVMGVSQGGMIAQHLTITYPQLVKKLILAVTVSRQNETVQAVVNSWINMAKENDYSSLIVDTMEKTYSEKKIKKYRPLYPVLRRVNKPKSFSRFITQAHACLTHNAYEKLECITCPTLVIGGDSDHVVGKNSSEEIADRIKGSKRLIYKGLGHGTYEEAKDFNTQIIDFLE